MEDSGRAAQESLKCRLEAGDGVKSIRWTFAHPVFENDVVDLATLGRWYVERVVTSDEPGAGLVYCKPA